MTDTTEAPVDTYWEKEHSPADLIKDYFQCKSWLESERARMETYFKVVEDRKQQIADKLLELLNNQGVDAFKTAEGTAYKSHLMNIKVENRDAILDWMLDNWDNGGNEMLMVSIQKDAIKQYQDAHEGNNPPGISTSWFTRVNIRRS